jgi:hypothetical protein
MYGEGLLETDTGNFDVAPLAASACPFGPLTGLTAAESSLLSQPQQDWMQRAARLKDILARCL